MDTGQYYYPALSWAAVIALGAGAYLYYNPSRRSAQSAGRRQPEQRPVGTQPRAGRAPVSVDSDNGSSTNAKKAPKPRKKVAPAAATSGTTSAAPFPVATRSEPTDDAAEDDAEWAARLADLRKGSKLEPARASTSKATRTVKQTTAAAFPTSSTAGANADDDRSPERSPVRSAARSQDVSDMLEPSGPAPSVLRVTESAQPAQARAKNNGNRAAPAQETKKQRQNRKKAEERKAAQEQAEKERQALLEKQRRQAREARGEPAKDGSAFLRSAPQSNAWNRGDTNGTATPLLETFEANPPSPSSSTGPSAAASTSTSGANWERELPSEEEQMRKLIEDEASMWNTVSSKKQRKKGAEPATAPAATAATSGSEDTVQSRSAASAAAAPAPKLNGTYVPPKLDLGKGHPDDSEW